MVAVRAAMRPPCASSPPTRAGDWEFERAWSSTFASGGVCGLAGSAHALVTARDGCGPLGCEASHAGGSRVAASGGEAWAGAALLSLGRERRGGGGLGEGEAGAFRRGGGSGSGPGGGLPAKDRCDRPLTGVARGGNEGSTPLGSKPLPCGASMPDLTSAAESPAPSGFPGFGLFSSSTSWSKNVVRPRNVSTCLTNASNGFSDMSSAEAALSAVRIGVGAAALAMAVNACECGVRRLAGGFGERCKLAPPQFDFVETRRGTNAVYSEYTSTGRRSTSAPSVWIVSLIGAETWFH